MRLIPPLPEDVRRSVLVTFQNAPNAMHPGLVLDKYVTSWDEHAGEPGKLSEKVQKPACADVVQVSQSPPRGFDFEQLVQRRRAALAALDPAIVQATTTGPLTLHLARASALENAGICLHHVYGFAYLPGTGLKGMTRAYAETVWFPTQFTADSTGQPRDDAERDKAIAAWRTIEAVFGWSPNSDSQKTWKPNSIPRHAEADSSHVGEIVFHDAWPVTWPRLIEDILNSHHSRYYQGTDAPGDWDSPIPIYFLSVAAGQTFEFMISRRRADVEPELIERATEWLIGALAHAGVGAKTNAGYGSFRADQVASPVQDAVNQTWQQAVAVGKRQSFEATLELVTPAFLAGANQFGPKAAEDCTLRSATLRGLLRWWWRTLHAGFLDTKALRSLEAALWGDTQASGAIRIEVECPQNVDPILYDKKAIVRQFHLPQPPNRKTTQGLWYHSFGMDDTRNEQGPRKRAQRYFLPPETRWRVRITARSVQRQEIALTAETVLLEAQATLWLLCHFGGVGSKSRKGFGSLAQPAELTDWSLPKCRAVASQLRHTLAMSAGQAPCPSINDLVTVEDVVVRWRDHWLLLDQVGASAQAFAKQYKHQLEKQALGLPRRIGRPARGRFEPGPHVRKTQRHASPIFYHIARHAEQCAVRIVAFPANELPDQETSRQFLEQSLAFVHDDLLKRTRQVSPQQPEPAGDPRRATTQPATVRPPGKRPFGTPAKVTIVAERRKGGFDVREPGKPQGALTVGEPPEQRPQIGEEIDVFIHNDDPQRPQYRWDAPKPKQQTPSRRPKRRR